MKLTLVHILFLGFLSACGETATEQLGNEPAVSELGNPGRGTSPGADYSSLLRSYRCDMTVADVARVLGVPERSMGIPDYAAMPSFAKTGKCFFTVEGFGEDADGGQTQISWGSQDDMSMSDVKSEIESYSKNLRDMPESVRKITGLDLRVADTEDSYLAYQNKTGRIFILNEYHGALLLTYETARAGSSRTQEQQEALKDKMTQLANYLLEKHKS